METPLDSPGPIVELTIAVLRSVAVVLSAERMPRQTCSFVSFPTEAIGADTTSRLPQWQPPCFSQAKALPRRRRPLSSGALSASSSAAFPDDECRASSAAAAAEAAVAAAADILGQLDAGLYDDDMMMFDVSAPGEQGVAVHVEEAERGVVEPPCTGAELRCRCSDGTSWSSL